MPASKLSLHIQAHTSWAEGDASLAPWIKVMDPPAGQNRWPGKQIVGRVFMPDNDSNALIAQGAAGADEWFRFCQPAFARAPYVTYWEAPNEPQPVDNLSFCRALSNFTARLADLMHSAGLRLIGGCLSEGNPGGNDAERRQRFQAIAPGLAQCDLWEQHCYFVPADYPHPEAGLTIWHAYRHLLNIDYAAQAGITLPPCYIGEAGIDLGIVGRPQQGWQALGLSHAAYMEQLAMFDDGLGPVTSAAVYTVGPVTPWHSFGIDQQLNDLINTHILSKQENPMAPRVYDLNGVERDFAWLNAKYGPSLRFLDAGAAPKFQLMRIDETTEHNEIKVRVLQANGQPNQNWVAIHWINAQPPLPPLTGGGVQTLWEQTGNTQLTDGNGFTSFAFNRGGMYGVDGGPYTAWIASPSLRSDGLRGIGWLGGTQYTGPLFLTFQIVTGDTPPPTPPPTPTPTPTTRMERLMALALPMANSSKAPKTVATRANDILTELETLA